MAILGRRQLGCVAVLVLLTLATGAPPYHFTVDPVALVKLQNEDAFLPCTVAERGGRTVVWFNGTEMVSLDRKVEGTDRATIIGEGDTFDLKIENVDIQDEGEYECQVFATPPIKLIHTLTINIPPHIFTEDENRSFFVHLNESVELECQTDGKPEPVVTWKRANADLPNGKPTVEGERLSLTNLGKQDGGVYICESTNGFGTPASETFEVKVLYAPTVTTEEHFIHSAPGRSVEIDCIFDGSRELEVHWMFNEEDIDSNTHPHLQIRDPVPTADGLLLGQLLISNLRPPHLGTYTCIGINSEGSTDASVLVDALPHNLQIISEPEGPYSDQYTIEWEVLSAAEPVEYYLSIKVVNFNNSGEIEAFGNVTIPAEKSSDDFRRQSYTIQGLSPNMTYIATLDCRNTVGHSGTTPAFEFYTPAVRVTAPPPTPKPEEDENQDKEDQTIGGEEEVISPPDEVIEVEKVVAKVEVEVQVDESKSDETSAATAAASPWQLLIVFLTIITKLAY